MPYIFSRVVQELLMREFAALVDHQPNDYEGEEDESFAHGYLMQLRYVVEI